MAAQIVLERLRLLAAERVHAKAHGVDEVAVVLNAVTPVGHAADVYRVRRSLKEAAQTLLVVLRQLPISSPVVSRTAGHQPHLYLHPLLWRQVRTHQAVDSLT